MDGASTGPTASNSIDGGAAVDGGDGGEAGASTSSPRALDGRWTLGTLPASFFGAVIANDSFIIDDGSHIFTFNHGDVGAPVPDRSGGPCAIASHKTVVNITIVGAYGSGTVSDLTVDQGPGCDSTALKEVTISQIDLQQTTVLPPTLTPYDGEWSVTLTDPNDATNRYIGVTFMVPITREPVEHPNLRADLRPSKRIGPRSLTVATDGTSDFAAMRQ